MVQERKKSKIQLVLFTGDMIFKSAGKKYFYFFQAFLFVLCWSKFVEICWIQNPFSKLVLFTGDMISKNILSAGSTNYYKCWSIYIFKIQNTFSKLVLFTGDMLGAQIIPSVGPKFLFSPANWPGWVYMSQCPFLCPSVHNTNSKGQFNVHKSTGAIHSTNNLPTDIEL